MRENKWSNNLGRKFAEDISSNKTQKDGIPRQGMSKAETMKRMASARNTGQHTQQDDRWSVEQVNIREVQMQNPSVPVHHIVEADEEERKRKEEEERKKRLPQQSYPVHNPEEAAIDCLNFQRLGCIEFVIKVIGLLLFLPCIVLYYIFRFVAEHCSKLCSCYEPTVRCCIGTKSVAVKTFDQGCHSCAKCGCLDICQDNSRSAESSCNCCCCCDNQN